MAPRKTDEGSERIDSPTSAGTYYYGACVDSVTGESDTGNNCSTGVEVIVSKVGEGNPDLVVQSPTVSSNNVEAGTSITLGRHRAEPGHGQVSRKPTCVTTVPRTVRSPPEIPE